MYCVKVHVVNPVPEVVDCMEPLRASVSGENPGENSEAAPRVEEEENSGGVQKLRFASGNPRVEATRGVVHLFRDTKVDAESGNQLLPAGRSEHLCVLAVPNHMTGSDFCQFTGSFLQSISEIRMVRTDGVKDRYCVLMSFDSLDSADAFYQHYNGKNFSSLEEEVCHVLYTADVQYTDSEEQASTPPAGLTELPNCPVCLERLDQHVSGILTTLCNHSFHSTCISKWTDSSCPVCRYCQTQSQNSTCSVCGTSESLWICVICGFVGCGRYEAGHAENHFKLTYHCYSLELETQRVWDYVGDGYVHRLIQSKTDGKLVELAAPCREGNDDNSSCECSRGSDIMEAVHDSKLEAIAYEYNHLLTTQLESQRQHYEGMLVETEQRMSKSVEQSFRFRLQKLQEKMEAKMDVKQKELEFLQQVNKSLAENQAIWQQKLKESEERYDAALKAKDEKISDLEEQVRDCMVYIEAQKTIEHTNVSDIRDGTVIAIPTSDPQINGGSRYLKGSRRRR